MITPDTTADFSANQQQVGGTHYASEYQHWDFVVRASLGYFGAQVSRYLYRWPKKGGLEDLRKALHYIEKYLEVRDQYNIYSKTSWAEQDLEACKFCDANNVPAIERAVIRITCAGDGPAAWWHTARDLVRHLISNVEAYERAAGAGAFPTHTEVGTNGAGASGGPTGSYVNQGREEGFAARMTP